MPYPMAAARGRTISPSVVEYVVNGGFTSDADGWTVVNGSIASAAGGAVGNCLRITNVGTIACAWQQLTIPAGSYRVRVFEKNGTAAGRITISATPYDYGGVFEQNISSGPWALFDQEISISIDNPIINLWVNSVTDAQYCDYDEVSVQTP